MSYTYEAIEAELEALSMQDALLASAMDTATIMKFSPQHRWAFVALTMARRCGVVTEQLVEAYTKGLPPVYLATPRDASGREGTNYSGG